MSGRIINREERRKRKIKSPEVSQSKENNKRKKIAMWIKSLPKDKQMFLSEYISSENNKAFEKYTEQFTEGLDRCLTALMIEETDDSLENINIVLNKLTEIIIDDNKKVLELKRLSGGDWMKSVDRYKEDLMERSLELINKGVKDKEAKDTLVIEFPKLSRAMITNAYKKVKEESKSVLEAAKGLKEEINVISGMKEYKIEVDPEVEKAMEFIFSKEEKKVKVEKEMTKKADKESLKETGKLIREEVISPSNIEVLSIKVIKELEASTEFGIVQAKSGQGIKFKTPDAEIFFGDVEQLESFYNVGRKIFEML